MYFYTAVRTSEVVNTSCCFYLSGMETQKLYRASTVIGLLDIMRSRYRFMRVWENLRVGFWGEWGLGWLLRL